MLGIALILLLILVWAAPGYVLSRWLLPAAGPLERAATSLTLGIVTVSPTAFLVPLLMSSPETPIVVAGTSIFWLVVGLTLWKRWPCTPVQPLIDTTRSRYLVLGTVVLTGFLAFSTSFYALDTTFMWWHCPHLGSLYLMEDGSGAGVVSWDPDWQRDVTHLFMHDTAPGFGLKPVLKLQRPGNMAYLVQPLMFMSNAGLVAALWCSDFLIMAFAMLLAARHFRHVAGVFVIGGIFLWGVRILAGYQVNENCIALVVSLFMFHSLLRRTSGKAGILSALVAGVAAGHLFGIRPASLLLLPAALVLCGANVKRSVGFAVALLIAALPWLIVHGVTWGDPFTHPALDRLFPDQRIFVGTPFELGFYPLNFPFSSQIVTGPDHPFPALLKVPLELAQAYGVPFLTLALVGCVALASQRRLLTGVILWMAPVLIGLMLIVQLDYQKMSYTLLAMAPLPLLVGAGVGRFDGQRSSRAVIAVLAIVLFILVPISLRSVQLPVDSRLHSSYVNDDDGVIPERKNDPEALGVFDWDDERTRLTTPRVLPAGIRDLDFLWEGNRTGANLFGHAQWGHRSKLLKTEPIEGPIIVWSALRPNGLEHRFSIKTSRDPYILPNGALQSSGSGGGFLYLMRFPAPAPKSVGVHLVRENNTLKAAIKTSQETVEQERYVSFSVVDPSKDVIGQPELTVDGVSRTVNFVTVWSLPNIYANPDQDLSWVPQPRVIASYPWSLRWRDNAFLAQPGAPDTSSDLSQFTTACKSSKSTLLERCTTEPNRPNRCLYALVDSKQRLLAIREPPPVGNIFTTGSAMWRPAQNTDRCWRQLMMRDLKSGK